MKLTFLILFSLYSSVALSLCDVSLRSHPEECLIQERFQNLRQQYDELGIDYLSIRSYRALRFININTWNEHLAAGGASPWLVYIPYPETWLQWENGHALWEKLIETVNQDGLQLEHISSLHASSLQKNLFTSTSWYLKGARMGKIRSSFFTRAPEFWFRCEEKIGINGLYLIRDFDLKTSSGIPLISGTVSKCADGIHYYGHVKYLESTKVKNELLKWLSSVNKWMLDFRQSKAGTLSPFTAIADFQRWFVSIHPFGDGNGRVSRFIQDILLVNAGFFPNVSGFLSNDVLTTREDYRNDFKNSMSTALDILESCLSEWQMKQVSARCDVMPATYEMMTGY